ncbi:MAG TPA: sterol desaturase family protein [Allosphingosinicella sp.]|jgi:sterol desaturase/sphingolipid hydroxylase (fatty acid hydroxylase superfamily)
MLHLSPVPAAAMVLALALALRGAVPSGRRRPVRLRPLARALFPRRLIRSASGRLDIAGMAFSLFGLGAMLGWALVSADWWAQAVAERLGEPVRAAASPVLAWSAMTVAVFVAYEGAYWVNHWMSHRLAPLWAFHKVHHSATSLSPLTNFRVHPVDTILFYNMASAATGATAAVAGHWLGVPHGSVAGANLLVFVCSIVLTQLQHTHLWIATTGRWGRVVLSPAHHQLHHSVDPRHHNCNLGSSLALFDWLAGTLRIPSARRERLAFGIADPGYDPHGAKGAVLMPFVEAGRHLLPAGSPRGAAEAEFSGS